MLMTEKEMVRVRVQLDDMEKEALELVDMIAEGMFGVLTDHNKKSISAHQQEKSLIVMTC